MTIGDRLKQARKSKGLFQDLLDKKMVTSRGVIINIEHNKIDKPQPIIVNTICKKLSPEKTQSLNSHTGFSVCSSVSVIKRLPVWKQVHSHEAKNLKIQKNY